MKKLKFKRPGRRVLIGLGVVVAVVIGGVLIAYGATSRPNAYAHAMNNIAEARHFMKYAHTGDICVQFSIGQREEPYGRDGRAGRLVDMALLSVEAKNANALRDIKNIEGTIRINQNSHNFTLEQNPFNALNFAMDIIRVLSAPVRATDEVEVTLFIGGNNHPVIPLQNAMPDGAISWDRAVQIASDHIGDKVRGKQFEVLVSIMHSVAASGSFWYVQFITTEEEIFFVVIAPDGSVIG